MSLIMVKGLKKSFYKKKKNLFQKNSQTDVE